MHENIIAFTPDFPTERFPNQYVVYDDFPCAIARLIAVDKQGIWRAFHILTGNIYIAESSILRYATYEEIMNFKNNPFFAFKEML